MINTYSEEMLSRGGHRNDKEAKPADQTKRNERGHEVGERILVLIDGVVLLQLLHLLNSRRECRRRLVGGEIRRAII